MAYIHGNIDDLLSLPGFTATGRLSRSSSPPLPPEEADSLLSQIGGNVMGGLQNVAYTLDTPAGIVRNLLAGENPLKGIGSQFSERTTGRDLLESYGLAPKDKTTGISGFWNDPVDKAYDIAGFATEVLTDPLFFVNLPGRALTTAGKAAARTGRLPYAKAIDQATPLVPRPGLGGLAEEATKGSRSLVANMVAPKTSDLVQEVSKSRAAGRELLAPTVASRISSGQGGLASIWNPFGQDIVLGTGKGSERFAEKVVDPVGQFLQELPVVRHTARFFDAGTRGAQTRTGQELARSNRRSVDAAETAAKADILKEQAKLTAIAERSSAQGINPDYLGPVVRSAESKSAPALAAMYRSAGNAEAADAVDLGIGLKQRMAQELSKQADAGFRVSPLNDTVSDFLPRRRVGTEMDSDTFVGSSGSQMEAYFGREKFLKDIPGGTQILDKMVGDPRIAGKNATMGPDYIASVYYGRPLSMLSQETQEQIGSLSKWLRGQPDEVVKRGYLFTRNPVVDVMDYSARSARNVAQVQPVYDMLARHAFKSTVPEAMDATLSVYDVLKRIDKEVPGVLDVAKPTTTSGATIASGAGGRGQGAAIVAADRIADFLGIPKPKTANEVQSIVDMRIPKEVVPDVLAMAKIYADPKSQSGLSKLARGFNNVFKSGVYTLWPASHMRNFYSGSVQNAIVGATDPRYRNPISGTIVPLREIGKILNGDNMSLVGKNGVGDVLDQAGNVMTAQQLRDEMFASGVISGARINDSITPYVDSVNGIYQAAAPGRTIGKELRKAPATVSSYFKPRTSGTYTGQVANRVGQALGDSINSMSNVGGSVEDAVRGAHYLARRRQGYTPEQAAASVFKTQYDYRPTSFTPEERAIRSYAVPFYSFLKSNLSRTAQEVAAAPGGRIAQTIRGMESVGRDPSGFVNPEMRERGSVPLGPEVDGRRKYLSSLGLMPQEAFFPIKTNSDGFDSIRSGESILSTMSPLIKLPYEYLTQRNLLFGKDLEDVPYTQTGSKTLDQILYNSPLARAASTVRQAVDDYKGPGDLLVNWLLGLRTTDVLTQGARAAAREELERILLQTPGARTMDRVYVPKAYRDNLTPEQQLLFRLYNSPLPKTQL